MKTTINRNKIFFIVGGIFISTLLLSVTLIHGAEIKEVDVVAPAKEIPEYYKKPYVFTRDFFTDNGRIALWEKTLAHLKGKPGVHYLEIGVFEGRSLIWMMENILVDASSRASAVDIFDGCYYENFLENLRIGKFRKKVKIFKGRSQEILRKLPLESYDVIYIDGSHRAEDVLIDAVLSWGLLKKNGTMIFDDYKWEEEEGVPLLRPEIAIDAFMAIFKESIEVLDKGWQVVIRKRNFV